MQAALEGLAAERAALAREREARAHGLAGLQSGTQGAVRVAVAEVLAGAARERAAAVEAATGPLLAQLLGVAPEAAQAEAALRRVVLWEVGAVTVVVGWLMSSGVLWWDAGAVAAVRVEKRQLQAEIQATHDA